MARRLFAGGRVVDPVGGRVAPADVLVDGGRVLEVGRRLDEAGAERVDCRGRHLAPGFVDMHCHLREPGREDEETVASGCRAARAGGFTHVCPMPNTEPAVDTEALVRFLVRRGEDAGLCRVHPVGCCTRGRQGRELADLGGMRAAGCVAVSDDGDWIADARVMRRVLEYAKVFDLPVLSHCELPEFKAGVANEGVVSTRLGLEPVPAAAEAAAAARDVLLAELTGSRLHVCHVSCAATVDVVRRAKERGVAVTAETCPHYLVLNDEAIVGFDSNYRVNPPLRSEVDRRAVVAALEDGVIDAIATDHAPHSREEKETEFGAAAPGIIGLQTAFSLGFEELVLKDVLGLPGFISRLSSVPAQILGLPLPRIAPDCEADFVVLDLDARWQFTPADSLSLSRNTPFLGRELRGRVVATVLGDSLLTSGGGSA
ncbi:dihydroorotase [candidate division WOR-3 bacterium]|nr:dihydroorotase [candidate division WOR-3 bacterium]